MLRLQLPPPYYEFSYDYNDHPRTKNSATITITTLSHSQCYNKGAYEEAVSLLNKAINAEKNEKGIYINRGDCFLRLEEYLYSLADYRQVERVRECVRACVRA